MNAYAPNAAQSAGSMTEPEQDPRSLPRKKQDCFRRMENTAGHEWPAAFCLIPEPGRVTVDRKTLIDYNK